MFHRGRCNRKALVITGFLLIAGGLLVSIPIHASGQESLSLSVDRNIGIGFGAIIQGTFTLRGSGPAEVQNLTVYFNGVQVHFATGNVISWQFHTGDYAPGATNITLFGVDDSGGTYRATREVFILGETMSTVVVGIIMFFVVVLVIVKYGPVLRKKRSHTAG